ncbi:MAG TPA: hypothetical protein VGH38_35865 [Bryobacteraceae bacterium]
MIGNDGKILGVKKTVWLAIVFVLLVIGYVVYSSFGGHRARCRVCMVFKGGRDCRTASADTRQEALRTAVTNACAQLSGGVTETNQCETTPPESVTWLQ